MRKVFGIGLNKTGTKTLGACLKLLGYHHTSYNFDLLEKYSFNKINEIRTFAENFESFEDWPWPLVYKELDLSFPASKFILTIRKSEEIWYESLCKHSIRTGPTKARKIVYNYEMPQEHKNKHIEKYRKHNREVIEYFSDKPNKLLIICWENGDGWKELCDFLNIQIPKFKLPHENKSLT